jgi:phosphodiesterase/alkaline phosphatase D-like protein
MATLVLGPMLRHVDDTSATVWVETSDACEVTVLSGSQRTFRVGERHYALVLIEGLRPGTSTDYGVRLDGEPVWPPAETSMPAPRIRTAEPGRPVRLAFGSCRYASPLSVMSNGAYGTDALDTYARHLAAAPDEEWPDGLLLLGDQVYADDTSPITQDVIRRRRDTSKPPGLEVADFDEYAVLYGESWGDPLVRWLYATVPTAMIFDDHDMHDDWNTSAIWRRRMQRTSWWQERISGGLAAYWVYQHLGNLSPAGLADDEIYAAVRKTDGDCGPLLHEFGAAADREADGAKGYRWSYRRDVGPVTIVVIDSRCGRILDDRERAMIGHDEARWIEHELSTSDGDHLVVATSLPWLLPRAVHDLESWDEALCAGARGERMARFGEKMREGADLEHWAAFRGSFDWLSGLLEGIARGESAPATICVLSGDVHHQYVAEAHWPSTVDSRVYQIVASPVHHTVPLSQRLVFRLGWSRLLERVTTALGRWDDVPPLPLRWTKTAGPFFGNALAELTLDGRAARFTLRRADAVPDQEDTLTTVTSFELTNRVKS